MKRPTVDRAIAADQPRRTDGTRELEALQSIAESVASIDVVLGELVRALQGMADEILRLRRASTQ